jgi:hypothetical protein
MKKIILALTVFANCTVMMSQTEFDALKYTQKDINGTARYMGMAGAFGALGGDASAIKDNPAGLGIYRKSELVGTMNVMMQNTNANKNGTIGYGDLYKTGANNFSIVLAIPTWRNDSQTEGLLSSNFSFSYNRLKNFNRSLNVKSDSTTSSLTDYMGYFTGSISPADLTYTNSYEPFDNTDVPWISVMALEGKLITQNGSGWKSLLNRSIGNNEKVLPSYFLTEKGYIDEYSMGWAGNYNNKFYFGITANIKAINYTAINKYGENFGSGGGLNLLDTVSTKGNGINMNLGAIYRPNNFLRFGLSVHVPTIYKLEDNYYSKLNFDAFEKGYIKAPDGSSKYQLQEPWQINVSGALIVGKKGLLSAEYAFTNFTDTRLMGEFGDSQEFNDENAGMKDMLNDVRTLKIGGEYKLNDNFSVRGGFANSSSATKTNAAKLMRYNTVRTDTEYFLQNSINYLSAGFGYREANWFVDFAYMHKILDESFYPYNSNALTLKADPAKVLTTTDNLVITLGLKF